MSKDVAAELRRIQALLAGHQAGTGGSFGAAGHTPPPPPPPPPVVSAVDTSDSEDDLPPAPATYSRKIKSGAAASGQQAQVHELERQLAALRQQHEQEGDRCKRLEEALGEAQRDGALVGSRLRGELLNKQEESAQLAELVMQVREEADELRHQLHHATSAAQASGHSAHTSLEQLQAAAAEWRRQGEDSLELLAEERERSASLQTEAHRLQAQVESLHRQLGEERDRARAATAEAAGLSAATALVGGPAGLVADLRQRLRQERAWRKAVTQWLQGEMATRADLERVLVNVGAAARTHGQETQCTGWGVHGAAAPPPPLPPRRMGAAQLAQQQQVQRPASPTAVHVTVHSPPGGHTLMVGVDTCTTDGSEFCGRREVRSQERGARGGRKAGNSSARDASGSKSSSGGGSSGGDKGSNSRADWRDHFQQTMAAFDDRHTRLQAELSTLRREALLQAT